MPLEELLPVVSALSHQDKLRLIHFLLLKVAIESGCDLRSTEAQILDNTLLQSSAPIEEATQAPEELLLKQLASTEAVVWSPYNADEAAATLANLLAAARQEGDAQH